MRYYAILIGGTSGTVFPVIPGAAVPGAQWCTVVNGKNDPSAQQIEFQIEEMSANTPSENSILTIYGIPFEQIRTSGDLVGKTISIYGGMFHDSFPLAAEQSSHTGLLMQGIILKCWGNWIGTEMSIGFSFAPSGLIAASAQAGGSNVGGGAGGATIPGVVPLPQPRAQFMRGGGFRSLTHRPYARGVTSPAATPAATADPTPITQLIPAEVGSSLTTGSNPGLATSQIGSNIASFFGGGNMNPLAAPINMIHNMMPNTPVSSAIQETLSRAFPSANLDINVAQGIQMGYQDAGMYQSVEQYAKYIQQLSHSVMGSDQYLGINISAYDNTIHVWDGMHPWSSGVIQWFDLIGQPTWIEPLTIHIKCVLRGDIHMGMEVTLPDAPMWANIQSTAVLPNLPEQKLNLAFAGTYIVKRVYHVGDFRNPDGANWSTNIHAFVKWATLPDWAKAQFGQVPQDQLNAVQQSIFDLQRQQSPFPQGTPQAARALLRETPKRRSRTVYG